jgi:hypothetical protein
MATRDFDVQIATQTEKKSEATTNRNKYKIELPKILRHLRGESISKSPTSTAA